MKKFNFFFTVLLLLVLFNRCSEEIPEQNHSEPRPKLEAWGDEIPQLDFRTLQESQKPVRSNLRESGQSLTWTLKDNIGTIANNGRDLIGLDCYLNQEVENGPNGDPISVSYDYDFEFSDGNVIVGWSNFPVEQVQITRRNNSLFLAYWDNGQLLGVINNIPNKGTVLITPTKIRINSIPIPTTSPFNFSFNELEICVGTNSAARNIVLVGFGELSDLGHFDCNGSNSVCAVYETCSQNCSQNFSDLVERNKFYVEWDDRAIPSSTVSIYLKKGSTIYDSVTGVTNDGLFDEFGLNFPRVSSNTSGFYVQVIGGGVTLDSQSFTVQND